MDRQSSPISERRTILVLGGLFAIYLATILMNPLVSSREAASHVQCKNNLKQIMLALHNYHDDFGTFPPAYTVDENGKRMHSWRTLIWPYLDDSVNPFTHGDYRFDEPWDSEHNRHVASEARIDGTVHVCPSDQTWNHSENYSETSYLAVVGDNTMWPGADSRSLKDVSGQAASIVMLVEVADSGIDFFEPRDPSFVDLSFPLNDPDGPYPLSQHQSRTTWPWQTPDRWVHVAMVDGSVKALPVSTSQQEFQAMFTVDDP